MKSKVLLLVIMLLLPFAAVAQESVAKMRARVQTLSKQIADKEKLLITSKEDVNSKMQNLKLIEAQIAERGELIAIIKEEIALCDKEIEALNAEVQRCEERVQKVREEYARSLRGTQKYSSMSGRIAFILSTNDVGAMLRRYRYVKEYASAHRKVANKLKAENEVLKKKRAEVLASRNEKEALLAENVNQQNKQKELAAKQQKIVEELKRDRKKVEAELNKQRRELNKVNAEIERAIEREIARKEEERKKQEREAAKKSAQAKAADGNAVAKNSKSNAAPSNPNKGVDAMAGSFVSNKGKMPIPITGPYQIISYYGLQKGVAGMGNVKIDYNGIVIAGKEGSQARCVFPGVVTSVVNTGDYAFVIVRHGESSSKNGYLTVYSNIYNIQVKEKQQLKAGDIIGDLFTDSSGLTSLLFQMRKEKVAIDPLPWLKR